MRVLRVFFLGLLYGWFMKWIIDEIYTRDNRRMITNENMLLRERLRELETPRSPSLTPETRPQLMQPMQRPELTQEPTRNEPASSPIPAPPETAAPQIRRGNQKDDLKLIKGIGPQLEKKLNSAGVMTFAQMSRLTAFELQAILGISKRVVQNTDNLLSQAKKLAEEKENR